VGSAGTVTSRWIISPRVDLVALIGGALAGYLLLFLYAGLHVDPIAMWFAWFVVLDSPHFFATYVRTVFDPEERARRAPLLRASLLCFLVGPVVLLGCLGLHAAGAPHDTTPWIALVVFVNLWAYWHVVRQHYGFMRLYQVKNGERSGAHVRQDGLLMHLGLMLPFIVFVLRHPESRRAFGLSAQFPAWPSWEYYVFAAVAVVLSYLILSFVVREAAKARRGEPLNVPKLLLFTAVLPLHMVVCFSQSVLTAPLITFSAFVTIYHDIQYHVLVYCHQQNRFRGNPRAGESGIAAILSKNVFIFGASAVAFGLLVRGFGCSIQVYDGVHQCFTPTLIGKVHLFGNVYSDTLLGAFFLGFPCHHYFVDQFIWKPSRDKNLRRDLNLEPAPA